MKRDRFEMFCCPNCNGDLEIREEFLFCRGCFKQYIVKNDIAVLLE